MSKRCLGVCLKKKEGIIISGLIVFFWLTQWATAQIRHKFDVWIPMMDGVKLSADIWLPPAEGR